MVKVKQSTFLLFILIVIPVILAVRIIHHDKPEETRISTMARKMKVDSINKSRPNVSTFVQQRQKRLLPYVNHYLSDNNKKTVHELIYQIPEQKKFTVIPSNQELLQSDNGKYTPFLKSNALRGPFTPIIENRQKNINVEHVTQAPLIEKKPDFSVIYDTLVKLKQAQQVSRPPTLTRYDENPVYTKPQINYVPMHYYKNQPTEESIKTIIETYTPTNIDIPAEGNNYEILTTPIKQYNERLIYKIFQDKPQMTESHLIEDPRFNYKTQQYDEQTMFSTPKPHFNEKVIVNKPVIVYKQKSIESNTPVLQKPKEYTTKGKQVIYTVQTTAKPETDVIIDEKYVAQELNPIVTTQSTDYIQMRQYSPIQFTTKTYEPKYEQTYYTTPTPNVQITNENTNILGKILKQLQNSNTLPHTLTEENVDNSIKTLIKILNILRKQQRLKIKPIVVADENSEGEDEGNVKDEPNYISGTTIQTFPANTVEGGTPGRPGIDYPALSSIPQTNFNCKTQRYKGFFGDPHTNCQVWHYCDLNGGQASFLCPNGTIFSQVALTCDWWYNVKCSSTTQLYVLNERLYKYILPLAPKFPEDYSGPFVDRYLALKFQEMEDKMKKEKKKDEKGKEIKDDSDHLQDIQNEKAKSSEET